MTRKSQKSSMSPVATSPYLPTMPSKDPTTSQGGAAVSMGRRSPREALHVRRSLGSRRLTPPPPIDEESPTSVVEWQSPLEQHMSRILNISPEDFSKLTLVSDNARIPSAPPHKSKNRTARPGFSKSVSENSVLRRFEKREYRWDPEVSPSVGDVKSSQSGNARTSGLGFSRQADRRDRRKTNSKRDIPPPPVMSVESGLRKTLAKSRGSLRLSDSTQGSTEDTAPLVDSDRRQRSNSIPTDLSPQKPSRVSGDPLIPTRASLREMKQTSDSMLVRPERRSSMEINLEAMAQFAGGEYDD